MVLKQVLSTFARTVSLNLLPESSQLNDDFTPTLTFTIAVLEIPRTVIKYHRTRIQVQPKKLAQSQPILENLKLHKLIWEKFDKHPREN